MPSRPSSTTHQPSAYAVQKHFRKVKYITLVNLLSTGELYPADLSPTIPHSRTRRRCLFPEYLTCEDKSAALAGHVIQWLTDPTPMPENHAPGRKKAVHHKCARELARGHPRIRADVMRRYVFHCLRL